MAGFLVISLDFELMWGLHDLENVAQNESAVVNGRKAIPQILSLFRKYNIHATWATVGLLMCKSKEEILQYSPLTLPEYNNTSLSSYAYLEKVGENEEEDPLHFGESLVLEIMNTPGQEVGSHTFSHYYCKEKGVDIKSFKDDTISFIAVAENSFGIKPKSIVFPRNQYGEEHIKELKRCNINNYRGNVNFLFNKENNKLLEVIQRIIRLADSYLPITGSNVHEVLPVQDDMLLNIPASRFFRPYSETLKNIEWLKLRRIKKSMLKAAKKNKMYHLWWHPHNFGTNTNMNLEELESILKYYSILEKKYDFTSVNMQEYHNRLIVDTEINNG